MNPYILHTALLAVSFIAVAKLRPSHPTEGQKTVIYFLMFMNWALNFTLVAVLSSATDWLWLSVGWLPIIGIFGWALWELWNS